MYHDSMYQDVDKKSVPFEAIAHRWEAHMLLLYGELPQHYKGQGADGSEVLLGQKALADAQALVDGDLVKKICGIAA